MPRTWPEADRWQDFKPLIWTLNVLHLPLCRISCTRAHPGIVNQWVPARGTPKSLHRGLRSLIAIKICCVDIKPKNGASSSKLQDTPTTYINALMSVNIRALTNRSQHCAFGSPNHYRERLSVQIDLSGLVRPDCG